MASASEILFDLNESNGRVSEFTNEQRKVMRAHLESSLYHFCSLVMGYDDLDPDLHGELCTYIESWGTEGRDRLMSQLPRGHLKCGRKSLLLQGKSGPVSLGDIQVGDEVATLNDQFKLSWVRVLSRQETPSAPLVEVQLKSGIRFECTPWHPLRTVLGWCRADELRPGTGIAAARKLPIPTRTYLRPYSAGALCGDGCGSNRTITCHDPEILARMQAEGTTLRFRSVAHIYGVPTTQYPKDLRCGAWHKRIPTDYEGSGAFLSGLYDTDGTVGMASGGTVSLATVSEQLARDVIRNLRYFGIVARLNLVNTKKPTGEPTTCWFVDFRGTENARRFQKHIGFEVTRKAANLQKLVDRAEPRSASRDWCVPPEWRQLLVQRGRGMRGGKGDIRKLRDAGIRCDNLYWTNQSKVLEAARILARPDLAALASPDLTWDQVVSAESVPDGDIVEIEVSDTHSYIGDLVLHHNSSVGTIANSVWQILKQPDQPIAIINASEDNATNWLRASREVFERSEWIAELWPEVLPRGVSRHDPTSRPQSLKWSDSEIELEGRRMGDPEPSISAWGLGASLAGHHWPKIIIDDIIGEKERASLPEMERAKGRIRTHTALMRPAESGRSYINCTPWTYDDVYALLLLKYGYVLYRRAALELPDRTPSLSGNPIFPKLFSKKSLMRIYWANPTSFLAQYMTNPIPGEDQAFDIESIRYFRTHKDEDEGGIAGIEIEPDSYRQRRSAQTEPLTAPRFVKFNQLNVACFLDPAPAEGLDRKREPNARNGLLVEGIDAWGRRYVLYGKGLLVRPIEVIHELFRLSRRYGFRKVYIEEVNFSSLYRHWIQDLQAPGRTYSGYNLIAIPLKPGRTNKDTRIRDKVNGWDDGVYYLNRVDCDDFFEEFSQYPYARTRDLLDAMAYDGALVRPLTDEEEHAALYGSRSRAALGADPVTGYVLPPLLIGGAWLCHLLWMSQAAASVVL